MWWVEKPSQTDLPLYEIKKFCTFNEKCIDKRLYPCYTSNMKTAVSLSDTLYEKAEQTAQYMGISRSKLFANALEEYIIRHNGEMVTQKLNEVYAKINPDEFARDLDIGIESLRELTKNDAW